MLTMSGGDNFTGPITLDDGALELTSTTAVGDGPITFGSHGGLLRIDGTTMPGNAISGFGVGDIIDLAGVSFDSNGCATGGPAGSLLISENGSSYSAAARSERRLYRSDLQPAERTEFGDVRRVGHCAGHRQQQRRVRDRSFPIRRC